MAPSSSWSRRSGSGVLRLLVVSGLCACCAVALAGDADVFSHLDTNRDAALSREEFGALERADSGGVLARLAGLPARAAAAGAGFVTAAWSSLSMIVATEIGDRTFFIAAIMSMRYNRATVFAGALGALVVMTVLSAAIGVTMPLLLPRAYTHYAAALLFLYFGGKLLREAGAMVIEGGGAGPSDELAETEASLAALVPGGGKGADAGAGGAGAGAGDAPGATGAPAGAVAVSVGGGGGGGGGGGAGGPGGGGQAPGGAGADAGSVDGSESEGGKSGAVRSRAGAAGASGGGGGGGSGGGGSGGSGGALAPALAAVADAAGDAGALAALGALAAAEWPVFSQSFSLTFLAEWGDRSQIATIAMAAAQDPFGVTLGGIAGHALCTGGAVIGGRMLAARISERAVALGGGALFLLFGVHALVVGPGA